MAEEQMEIEPAPRPAGEEAVVDEDDEEDAGPPPNNTIRVNNLNEKVKGKVLKNSLKAVFKQFGDILDIVAMDSVRCVAVYETLGACDHRPPTLTRLGGVRVQATRAGFYSLRHIGRSDRRENEDAGEPS